MFMIDMQGTLAFATASRARARRASDIAAPALPARRDRSRTVHGAGPGGRDLARQTLDRISTGRALDRQSTTAPSLLIASASAGRQTSSCCARRRELGGEQRAVGRAEDQDVVFGHGSVPVGERRDA